MAIQPLTALQEKVLIEIFRDRAAGPRSISAALEITKSLALRTIWGLRQKGYILHHQPPSCFGGSGPVYRPVLTVGGRPVADLDPRETSQQIAEYLRTHKIEKLPPGRAHGTYKSANWDREL